MWLIGNRSSCCPIQSVIILVINKWDSCFMVVWFCESLISLQTELNSTQFYNLPLYTVSIFRLIHLVNRIIYVLTYIISRCTFFLQQETQFSNWSVCIVCKLMDCIYYALWTCVQNNVSDLIYKCMLCINHGDGETILFCFFR